MKKLMITIILLLIPLSVLSQQDGDNTKFGIPKISIGLNATDTIPVLSGRSIEFVPGPNSLDGDDLADIIVTDWYNRIRVFEQTSKTSLEFKLVWSSPKLKPKKDGTFSYETQGTPRTVTYGDLDGNGKKEIIFPIGYKAADTVLSDTTWCRGIYIYECTGDNNYGTTPTILRAEKIDPDIKNQNWGRVEYPGLVVSDIDGDNQQELLIASAAFGFDTDLSKNPGKAWVISVKSGTFAQKNVQFSTEYIYTNMAKAIGGTDGYIPWGFIVADVDGDGKNEVVVPGRTNSGTGGALGFFKSTEKDKYSDGNVIDLTNQAGLNIFRVTGQLAKYRYQGKDLIFIKTDESSGDNRIILLSDIIDIGLVGANNISILKQAFWGGFTGGAIGDQDHGTGSDGFDFYFPYGNLNGGWGVYDLEYKGIGNIADSNNYKLYNIFDAHKVFKRTDPGLYEIIVPPTDLNNNGKKEIITNYQFWDFPDTLKNGNIIVKATIPFFVLEWGDTVMGTLNVQPLVFITDEDYKLEQNYPNPFNPTTSIRFTLPTAENISLIVYDINGREVRNLIDSKFYEKGSYETSWDGKNENGKTVASGNYFYKLKWGNFEKSMKMTYLK